MSDINITVEGGSSKRLLTAGKYCNTDIVVTSEGGAEDLDAVLTEQDALIDELKAVLQGKAEGSGITADDVAMNSIEGDLVLTCTQIKTHAFYYQTSITSIIAPNLTSIATYGLYNCSAIKTLIAPNVTNIDQYGTAACSAVKTLDFPKLQAVEQYVFRNCSALTSINLPVVTMVDAQGFYNCAKLPILDLPQCTSFGAQSLRYCSVLKTIILRSETMATLANTNALSNTPYATTGTDAYIYVPSALVDSYKAATNWSTYAARFRAIEDYPEITGG